MAARSLTLGVRWGRRWGGLAVRCVCRSWGRSQGHVGMDAMILDFFRAIGVMCGVSAGIAVAAAAVTYGALRWRERRYRPGHCPVCRYDLTGLAKGKACPECGKVQGGGADVGR